MPFPADLPFFADLLICLRFFSRLPVPSTERERTLGSQGLAAAAALTPLAGLVIAALPVSVLLATRAAGCPAIVAAVLALAALTIITGALHEDALADCADGLAGRGRERKLEIMHDSTIGAFGAVALVFSLLLRIVALAAAIGQGEGVAALLLSASLSRAACLLPLFILPPARPGGLGASLARPSKTAVAGAAATTVAIAGIGILAGVNAGQTVVALLIAPLMSLLVSALARWQIGGQTGDVAGAAQQFAEAAVLIVFSAV